MTEDQMAVNRNTITLQGGNLDLDVLIPDINWLVSCSISLCATHALSYRDIDFEDRIAEPQGHHVARQADITLQMAEDFQFDLDDPGYGFDLGPSDGIGSQDFGELDLGLDFGDGPAGAAEASVEVGRRATTPHSTRESLDSRMMGHGTEKDADIFSHPSRAPSEHPFHADMDVDVPFGPDIGAMDIDLGVDFGDVPPSERERTPGQTRSLSRVCKYRTVLSNPKLECRSLQRLLCLNLRKPRCPVWSSLHA